MLAISLQSGSNGNCIYVECGAVSLLFDAGISGRQAEARLAEHGRDIRSVTALFLSHDHSDHARCLGVYNRQFGLPVFATHGALETARSSHRLGKMQDVRCFRPGNTVTIGPTTVHSIPTPHDGIESVAYVVEHDGRRLGILTDLGFVFDELQRIIATLDAVVLESNYDPDMLENGSYPAALKRRIRGSGGHISNEEAARLLDSRASSRLQWACLAHLSEENNRPDLAVQQHRELIGDRFPIFVASRYAASAPMAVR